MQDNPFTFLGSAISQLLSSKSTALQATGLDIFRGLAVILIVWFGVKSALSASQGHGGGFHFAKFADLILMIAFGLGMLTYYSTPIPGTSYSFSDLITKEGLNLSNQIESSQTQEIANTITNAEQQLGAPPGSFNILEDLTYLLIVADPGGDGGRRPFASSPTAMSPPPSACSSAPSSFPGSSCPRWTGCFGDGSKPSSASASIRSSPRPSSMSSQRCWPRCSRSSAPSASRTHLPSCPRCWSRSPCVSTASSRYRS